MRTFLALASASVLVALTPALEPFLTIDALSYDYESRELTLTICNEGNAAYRESEFGSISYSLTIDHKTDNYAHPTVDVEVGECWTSKRVDPFTGFSGWGGIPQGDYELSVALKVYGSDQEPATTRVQIWKPIPPAADLQFSDFDQTFANASAIYYLRSKKIVDGYADNSFRPTVAINRAEFTKIVMGAELNAAIIDRCFETNGAQAPFRDVGVGQWFSTYVCIAKANGIIGGYPDGTFRPERTITFPEAAKILVQTYHGNVGSDVIWYKPYVEKLASMGAIPTSIRSFEQEVTRGEMAEMIYRLKEGITNKPSWTYDELANRGMVTHTDPAGMYSITYPDSWQGATHGGTSHVISMVFNEHTYARYAYILIQTPTVCPQAPSDADDVAQSIMLDGHVFTTHATTEGAAGMKYATTLLFSQVHPTACIVINKAVGTPNADPQNDMGAYTSAHAAIRDAEQAAAEAAVMNAIESIVIY